MASYSLSAWTARFAPGTLLRSSPVADEGRGGPSALLSRLGQGHPLTGAVSVLLVEDDAMVRSWVKLALGGSEFTVVGEAGTVAEAVEFLERRRPALLLVDQRLGPDLGTDLVRRLRIDGMRMPAVIMTATPQPGLNEQAREAGAQGSVLKTSSGAELLERLRQVVAGRRTFDDRHPKRPPGAWLSRREREVLALVAGGGTNAEIAELLGVSSETVKTLMSRIFFKLGAANRTDAVRIGRELGLL